VAILISVCFSVTLTVFLGVFYFGNRPDVRTDPLDIRSARSPVPAPDLTPSTPAATPASTLPPRPLNLSRLFAQSLTSPLYDRPFPDVPADPQRQNAVRDAFKFAWSGYSRLCWGADELKPVTGTCLNRLHAGLTIIDSLQCCI
jgi:hypothetical protein